jgi:DNA-binding Lrp family transcriptional regulator
MTKEVAAMQSISISGNVIPVEWYKSITKENGKPDLVAIQILADIVYWYKPTVDLCRKFNSDMLQKSYGDYADMLGVSKYVVKQSILRLETLGVIERDLRNIKVSGMCINNVLFLRLFPHKLNSLTGGGIPDGFDYAEYLKSDKWKKIARKIRDKYDYKCAECSSTIDLNVHHKTYQHIGNEQKHLDDLTLLCNKCHKQVHGLGDSNEL